MDEEIETQICNLLHTEDTWVSKWLLKLRFKRKETEKE